MASHASRRPYDNTNKGGCKGTNTLSYVITAQSVLVSSINDMKFCQQRATLSNSIWMIRFRLCRYSMTMRKTLKTGGCRRAGTRGENENQKFQGETKWNIPNGLLQEQGDTPSRLVRTIYRVLKSTEFEIWGTKRSTCFCSFLSYFFF